MSSDSVEFNPVRQIPAHELVLDQLRRSLELGQVQPGETLPPERDLALFFNVSRTVVRAAVSVLEREGSIVVRRGRGGGYHVQPPFDATDARRLILNHWDEIRDALDYGLIVETGAARLAAERRRAKDVTQLRKLLEEHATAMQRIPIDERVPQNVSALQGIDNALHLRIAIAARNELLNAAVVDARRRMWLPMGAAFWKLEEAIDRHHNGIVDAIDAGDAELAEARMRAHVNDTQTTLREWLST